jgi:hypothetical protein
VSPRGEEDVTILWPGQTNAKQLEVLICTPTILAKYEPQDYPNIKTIATAGEPTT